MFDSDNTLLEIERYEIVAYTKTPHTTINIKWVEWGVFY